MACDNRCCFDSVCVVEQALIEHQTLIRSYSEICSEKPAWLHSIEASFDRFVVVLMPIKRRFTDGVLMAFYEDASRLRTCYWFIRYSRSHKDLRRHYRGAVVAARALVSKDTMRS